MNQPLLDRFILSPHQLKNYSFTDYTLSIQQHIEFLLNYSIDSHFENKKINNDSIVCYGIKNKGKYNYLTEYCKDNLCELIEKTLNSHEKRLSQITVSLQKIDLHTNTLQVKISATTYFSNIIYPLNMHCYILIKNNFITFKNYHYE